MVNFAIKFSNPWFLLLLIPAFLLGIIPYFRLNKRYRKTRNRIVSIALHLLIMTLTISVLSGITIEYDTPQSENEVILLVDTSDSGDKSTIEAKNDFVKTIIENNDSMFKLGIVTFGYDQFCVTEPTNDMSGVYAKYLNAQTVANNTATDISSAMYKAAEMLKNPTSARIVLITDAQETDGTSSLAIKYIAAMGITVDTVYISGQTANREVQILEMIRPEETIKVGEDFEVELVIESSFEGDAILTPYDNDIAGKDIEVSLVKGVQKIRVPYSFSIPGMHKMSFEITSDREDENAIKQNNRFNSFIYLEVFDKVLILESINNESQSLCAMLTAELNVDVINIADDASVPKTVDDLRAYDEVVLCNISNDDMPEGFDLILQSYVRDFGGGLFTICGNDEDSNPHDDDFTANAYTREDMAGTIYQDMLPVEIIDYTPPVAVMVIIDRSGSMHSPGSPVPESESPLGYAKLGAEACLDALTERDYIGIMSLSDEYEKALPLTPRTMRAKILDAIAGIHGGGGTIFSDAIEYAGMQLAAFSGVEKRHIIIITDGEPSEDDEASYIEALKRNADRGITTSFIGIKCNYTQQSRLENLLINYAGADASSFYNIDDLDKLPEIMRKDLEAPSIKSVNYETFQPIIKVENSITSEIYEVGGETALPTLDGYYGVKTKDGAQTVIMGKYTPIYTQWQYGKGSVGTFACDLSGNWSADFVNSPAGKLLVNNIIKALFPTENIRPSEIDLELEGDNYSTILSVFTTLEDNEILEVLITSPDGNGGMAEPKKITANSTDAYSRLYFSLTTEGIHEIRAVKKDANGNELCNPTTIYKAIAYSKEYVSVEDTTDAQKLCTKLAVDGGGESIDDPWLLFTHAVEYNHNVINPKILFLIMSLVMFLLDIAVRKFKWKWPHEIIRDRKATAALKNGAGK